MNSKIILSAKILLGIIYVVFGLNFFLHFIPMPPMQGDGGTFMGILFGSGWLTFVKVLEIAGGLALLSNQYSRIAAFVLAPITVNILLFHTLVVFGPAMGIVMLILNGLIIFGYKEDYKGLFKRA